jgi:hypothetical protein
VNNSGISALSQIVHNGDQTFIVLSTPVDNEVLSELIDGITTNFPLANIPSIGSVRVYYNSGRQDPSQYSVQNNILILNFTPQQGDTLVIDYRY